MSFVKTRFIAAAGLAAFGLVASALAQDRPAAPPGAPSDPHAFAQRWKERFEHHQADRAKALHDVLGIRADQEAAFQAYAAALHPAHDGPKGEHGPRPGGPSAAPPATTPERLDRIVARLHEREQRIEARVTAVKTFYAALSTEQRRTFDSLPLLQAGGRGGHERWGPRA
ncbi:MAG TPA: Spy/CpxP family protein refolding chaperone [Caulobacteraceae bacterium]|nr:Spy/CpxP family protein refolding chaperone [Caulobacteraceae bacterium]